MLINYPVVLQSAVAEVYLTSVAPLGAVSHGFNCIFFKFSVRVLIELFYDLLFVSPSRHMLLRYPQDLQLHSKHLSDKSSEILTSLILKVEPSCCTTLLDNEQLQNAPSIYSRFCFTYKVPIFILDNYGSMLKACFLYYVFSQKISCSLLINLSCISWLST